MQSKVAKAFQVAMLTAAALEETCRQFEEKALAEEAKLDVKKKPMSIKLGEALQAQGIKLSELIRSWDPNGDGDVSKMEFRQNVRKLINKPDVKEVDALFDTMDEDKGGSLDTSELKAALKKWQTDAAASASDGKLRAAFSQASRGGTEGGFDSREYETAGDEQDRLERTSPLVQESEHGTAKSVTEVMSKWDKSGDGKLDKSEFRANVKTLPGVRSAAKSAMSFSRLWIRTEAEIGDE